jgi:hypothetical protein
MGSPDDARKWLMDGSGRKLAGAQQQHKITEAQSAARDAYAGSVGALVSDVARFDSEPIGATSQQRLNRRVDRARDRYTALENVADAMRALYATFDDEQRATADRILAATVPSLYEGSPFGGGGTEAASGQQTDSASRRRGRADSSHFERPAIADQAAPVRAIGLLPAFAASLPLEARRRRPGSAIERRTRPSRSLRRLDYRRAPNTLRTMSLPAATGSARILRSSSPIIVYRPSSAFRVT